MWIPPKLQTMELEVVKIFRRQPGVIALLGKWKVTGITVLGPSVLSMGLAENFAFVNIEYRFEIDLFLLILA